MSLSLSLSCVALVMSRFALLLLLLVLEVIIFHSMWDFGLVGIREEEEEVLREGGSRAAQARAIWFSGLFVAVRGWSSRTNGFQL